ncbi:MAG: DUF2306 domain-containing protein [Daejeonella sp.]
MKLAGNIISVIVLSIGAVLLVRVVFPYYDPAYFPNANFVLSKNIIAESLLWKIAFFIHIWFALLVIIFSPVQFINYIRVHYPRLHHFSGWCYITGVFIAAPAGLIMAWYANGGKWASAGFLSLGLLWLLTTWYALKAIRKGDIIQHEEWMIYSVALTYSSVTLRIMVPALFLFTSLSHTSIYVIIAWFSWIFNLGIAQLIINIKKRKIKYRIQH